jgi:Zn-dependent alcohol dehydrogenase
MKAIQSAAGKGASHQEIGKIKDKHLKDAEDLEEGLKDWARNTAMAGIIVAGLAGVNSISSAIDSSIPAIGAMETALEMAQKSGNDELAKMIEKDLSDSKIRLSSGKDLSFVTDMQEKYAKFMKTEGLTYESKLQVALNQQLK